MSQLNPHVKAVLTGFSELGQKEIVGLVFHNKRVVNYWKQAKIPMIVKDDETPWCAAFVGMCLENSKLEGSKSGLAKSYLKWGITTPEPKLFGVAVLNRADDPKGLKSTGHVGFIVGIKPNSLYLLGGNQGNKVSVAEFSKSRVCTNGYRWVSDVVPFVNNDWSAVLSVLGNVDDR